MEEILANHSEYFITSSLWMDILRSLGYMIVKGLKSVCNSALKLFDDAYTLLDFTQYGDLETLINSFKPVVVALLSLSLMGLGIMLVIQTEKPKNIVRTIFVSIAVVSLGTLMTTKMNTILYSSKKAMDIDSFSVSNQIITNNLVDLLYVDKENELTEFPVYYESVSSGFLDSLSPEEKVNDEVDGISETAKEVFDHYAVIDSSGNVEYINFEKSWLSFLDPPYYYRYKIDFLPIIISYIAMLIVLLLSSYKALHIIYEIAVMRILAYLYAADISSGQKLLKILDGIKNLYITLFLTTVFIKIYMIFSTYLSTTEFGSFSKSIFLLFAAFAVASGPNMIARITGTDPGLGGGVGKLLAAQSLARGAGHIAKGALVGNPMTQRKGLLNNRYVTSAASAGKEAFRSAAGNFASNIKNGFSEEGGKSHLTGQKMPRGDSSKNGQSDTTGKTAGGTGKTAGGKMNLNEPGNSRSKNESAKSPKPQDISKEKVGTGVENSEGGKHNQEPFQNQENGMDDSKNADVKDMGNLEPEFDAGTQEEAPNSAPAFQEDSAEIGLEDEGGNKENFTEETPESTTDSISSLEEDNSGLAKDNGSQDNNTAQNDGKASPFDTDGVAAKEAGMKQPSIKEPGTKQPSTKETGMEHPATKQLDPHNGLEKLSRKNGMEEGRAGGTGRARAIERNTTMANGEKIRTEEKKINRSSKIQSNPEQIKSQVAETSSAHGSNVRKPIMNDGISNTNRPNLQTESKRSSENGVGSTKRKGVSGSKKSKIKKV